MTYDVSLRKDINMKDYEMIIWQIGILFPLVIFTFWHWLFLFTPTMHMITYILLDYCQFYQNSMLKFNAKTEISWADEIPTFNFI